VIGSRGQGDTERENLLAEKYKFEWESLLQDALVEQNAEILREKVAEAEATVFLRLQALEQTSDSSAERQALRDASDTLLSLKRNRLKFPDWKPD
jgi:hypothetical protein